MKTPSSFTMFEVFVFHLLFFVNTRADEVYVSTLDTLSDLYSGFSTGQIDNPYISIEQAIYETPQSFQRDIYISPDYHQLACLKCPNCQDQCEIMRGGSENFGKKQIRIKT